MYTVGSRVYHVDKAQDNVPLMTNQRHGARTLSLSQLKHLAHQLSPPFLSLSYLLKISSNFSGTKRPSVSYTSAGWQRQQQWQQQHPQQLGTHVLPLRMRTCLGTCICRHTAASAANITVVLPNRPCWANITPCMCCQPCNCCVQPADTSIARARDFGLQYSQRGALQTMCTLAPT